MERRFTLAALPEASHVVWLSSRTTFCTTGWYFPRKIGLFSCANTLTNSCLFGVVKAVACLGRSSRLGKVFWLSSVAHALWPLGHTRVELGSRTGGRRIVWVPCEFICKVGSNAFALVSGRLWLKQARNVRAPCRYCFSGPIGRRVQGIPVMVASETFRLVFLHWFVHQWRNSPWAPLWTVFSVGNFRSIGGNVPLLFMYLLLAFFLAAHFFRTVATRYMSKFRMRLGLRSVFSGVRCGRSMIRAYEIFCKELAARGRIRWRFFVEYHLAVCGVLHSSTWRVRERPGNKFFVIPPLSCHFEC